MKQQYSPLLNISFKSLMYFTIFWSLTV